MNIVFFKFKIKWTNWGSTFNFQFKAKLYFPECSLQIQTDLVNIIYLTLLLVLSMILSFHLKNTSSSSSAPEFIWIISLPTVAVWLGWLSLAFIFESQYLKIKSMKLKLNVSWWLGVHILSTFLLKLIVSSLSFLFDLINIWWL